MIWDKSTIVSNYLKIYFNKILYNKKILYSFPPVQWIKTKESAVAGDYVFVDGNNTYIIFDKDKTNLAVLKHYINYTPIGIVTVPGSHNIYNTNEIAICSLYHMTPDSPDDGKGSQLTLLWGPINNDLSSLPNYTQWYCYGSYTDIKTPYKTQDQTCFPSDIFYQNSQYICQHDKNSFYADIQTVIGPSPYLSDGSKNPVYLSTGNNALSDINGKSNTASILSYETAQPNWKTDSSIINNAYSGYYNYPAACCCWRYHTKGTNQGDWYLPAIGEVGYYYNKKLTIENSIQNIIDNYNIGYIIPMTQGGFYGSSTEQSNWNIIRIHNSSARLWVINKNDTTYLCIYRAFMRI